MIDLFNLNEYIKNWIKGRERFLNLITAPFNSSDIFIEVILYLVNNGERVLYITNENENNVDILKNIKKYTNFRGYAYVKPKSSFDEALFVVSSQRRIQSINKDFSLVIYDDINSFPVYRKEEIEKFINDNYNENTKYIFYSIESIIQDKRDIIIPARKNKLPILEPAIITTRIDITKDMPYIIYEYLKWSVESQRKVIIYVPDKDKVISTYSYLKDYCRSLCKSLYFFIKGETEKKIFDNFMKHKSSILVSNDYSIESCLLKGTDILVFFSDNELFNYKMLIHFCAEVEKNNKINRGDVVFLANTETADMTLAKDKIRNFNKEAWENGLLKI